MNFCAFCERSAPAFVQTAITPEFSGFSIEGDCQ
jgi:hypothetical protein